MFRIFHGKKKHNNTVNEYSPQHTKTFCSTEVRRAGIQEQCSTDLNPTTFNHWEKKRKSVAATMVYPINEEFILLKIA